MVQLKYFGDNRDFFKYDLITSIFCSTSSLCNYVFVPMLTEHRVDNEGNIPPRNIGGKSEGLLSFIKGCENKSLTHWKTWLLPLVNSYETIEPSDSTFFSDRAREQYWENFNPMLIKEDALIFIDPDTGLETGKPSYLNRMGREKYILNEEIDILYNYLHSSSILMVYQHLPNNKDIHQCSVRNKLSQLKAESGGNWVCAYREDDLAFLFIAKNKDLFNELRNILKDYYDKSLHKLKSLHFDNSS